MNTMKYHDSKQTLIVMLEMHNCRHADSDPGIWDDRLSVRESLTLEVIDVSAFWRPSGFLLLELLKLFGILEVFSEILKIFVFVYDHQSGDNDVDDMVMMAT